MTTKQNITVFAILTLFLAQYGIAEESSDKVLFRVVGVRSVIFSDSDQNIRPFGYSDGISIAVLCTLPESSQSAFGLVTEVVTDNNENLIKNLQDSKIYAPSFSTTRKEVLLEIKTDLPLKKAERFKRISGSLEYMVGSGSESVDLGITSFLPEAKGIQYDAQIQSIDKNEFEPNTQTLSLSLNIPKDSIKGVTFLDDSGHKIEVSQNGYLSIEDLGTTLMFNLPANFPQTGKIILEKFGKSEKRTAPFVITNIDFLGRTCRKEK